MTYLMSGRPRAVSNRAGVLTGATATRRNALDLFPMEAAHLRFSLVSFTGRQSIDNSPWTFSACADLSYLVLSTFA